MPIAPAKLRLLIGHFLQNLLLFLLEKLNSLEYFLFPVILSDDPFERKRDYGVLSSLSTFKNSFKVLNSL